MLVFDEVDAVKGVVEYVSDNCESASFVVVDDVLEVRDSVMNNENKWVLLIVFNLNLNFKRPSVMYI